MSKHYSRYDLDIIAKDGHKLKDLPGILVTHLRECSICRQYYEEALEYWQDLEEELKASISEAEQTHLNSIVAPGLWKTARMFALNSIAKVDGDTPVTLAAESENVKLSFNFLNRGVFSTTDGKLLIRLLEDNATGALRLFLLADDPLYTRNTLVFIPSLGVEAVSDNNGVVDLGHVQLPRLEDMEIKIRMADATFGLALLYPEVEQLVGQGAVKIGNQWGDQIQLEIMSETNTYALRIQLLKIAGETSFKRYRVMITRRNKPGTIQPVRQGMTVFRDIVTLSGLQVKVYSS